jgi:hypothetical protein
LDLEPNLPHNNIYTADVVDNLQLKPYKLQILDLLRQGEKKVEPNWVDPKTIKMVFVASSLSMHH